MSKKNKESLKIIRVIVPSGSLISYCSREKANDLVNTNRATWKSCRTILLKKTKKEILQERKDIIEESGRTCYICGKYMEKDSDISIDHVVPKSLKFPNVYDKDNQRCCCKRCNTDKANRTLSEYLEHIDKNRFKYKYITNKQLRKLRIFAKHHEKKYIKGE